MSGMKTAKIFILGSINMDLVCYVDELPKLGQTIFGNTFSQSFGGKGSNQAYMAGQLASPKEVTFVGCVGDDSFGEQCVSNLQKVGVDTDPIQKIQSTPTGVALVTVTPKSNTIVVISGANFEVREEVFKPWIDVVQKARILVIQFEIPLQTNLFALKKAKEANVITLVNPAPTAAQLPSNFFDYVDIICPNEVEAGTIFGIEVNDIESAQRSATSFLEKHKKKRTFVIIITLGKDGCVLAARLEDVLYSAVHLKTDLVDAVDSTGAGDCFIGSLAYFLAEKGINNWSVLNDSVQRSLKIASVSVTRKGAQSSYPKKSELTHILC